MASIGGAVVGHDTLDRDAVAGEPVEGAVEEGNGAFFLLVWQEFGVGEPRGVAIHMPPPSRCRDGG